MATTKDQKQARLTCIKLLSKAQQRSELTPQQAESLAQEAVGKIRTQRAGKDSHEYKLVKFPSATRT